MRQAAAGSKAAEDGVDGLAEAAAEDSEGDDWDSEDDDEEDDDEEDDEESVGEKQEEEEKKKKKRSYTFSSLDARVLAHFPPVIRHALGLCVSGFVALWRIVHSLFAVCDCTGLCANQGLPIHGMAVHTLTRAIPQIASLGLPEDAHDQRADGDGP